MFLPNTLFMARIDYRGHRLLAQSFVPGILDIDNGEKFNRNEELNSKVAEVANLENYSVHDLSGKAFTLVAPATSKDKRQYILHFPRDTPRDANNARSDSLFCILRPELIAALFRAQEIEKDAEESVTIPDSRGQRIVVDEEVVTKAKHRLLNDVVPSFVVDFDCRNGPTLTEKLHKYGINVRYIGEVAKRAADPDLQKLCSNEIIVRSAKHILKAVLRNTENHDDHHQAISHFLNCLFANVDASLPDSNTTNGGSCSMTQTSYLSITPKSLWSDIQRFAKFKYQYELKDRSYANDKEIHDLMEDILCKKVVITMEKRQIASIAGFYPVVKSVILSEAGDMDEPENIQVAKALLSEAIKSYSPAFAILDQATGPPFLEDVAGCCRFLALMLHHAGDKNNGIMQQQGEHIINERSLGYDQSETAHSGEADNNTSLHTLSYSGTVAHIVI